MDLKIYCEKEKVYDYSFPGQQFKTGWIKENKPVKVELINGGETETIDLKDTQNKSGQHVLTGFKRVFNDYSGKVIFSYGVDPARPSFAGTVIIAKVKGGRPA
jgi:hypothetical protein